MVSVITCTKRGQFLEQAVENFTRQTFSQKELLIVINKDEIDADYWKGRLEKFPHIHVLKREEDVTLGECLNDAAALAKYPILAKFDDDDYYSPDYLSHSLQVMKETGASVAGKAAIFVYFQLDKLLTLFRAQAGQQFLKKKPREFLAGATLLFKKEVWEQVGFRSLNTGEDVEFQRDCLNDGFKLYSGSCYDFAAIRYGSGHKHTWAVPDEVFRKHSRPIAFVEDYGKYVREGWREA